jgi:hypothetical protein
MFTFRRWRWQRDRHLGVYLQTIVGREFREDVPFAADATDGRLHVSPKQVETLTVEQ